MFLEKHIHWHMSNTNLDWLSGISTLGYHQNVLLKAFWSEPSSQKAKGPSFHQICMCSVNLTEVLQPHTKNLFLNEFLAVSGSSWNLLAKSWIGHLRSSHEKRFFHIHYVTQRIEHALIFVRHKTTGEQSQCHPFQFITFYQSCF